MTPKIKGLRSALEKLHHNIEFESDKLAKRIETETARVPETFKAVNEKIDAQMASVSADLGEVTQYLDDLQKMGNGGPPLEGSSGSSEKREPAASWSADKRP